MKNEKEFEGGAPRDRIGVNLGEDAALRLTEILDHATQVLKCRRVNVSQIVRAALQTYHEALMKSENVSKDKEFLEGHRGDWGGVRA